MELKLAQAAIISKTPGHMNGVISNTFNEDYFEIYNMCNMNQIKGMYIWRNLGQRILWVAMEIKKKLIHTTRILQ